MLSLHFFFYINKAFIIKLKVLFCFLLYLIIYLKLNVYMRRHERIETNFYRPGIIWTEFTLLGEQFA